MNTQEYTAFLRSENYKIYFIFTPPPPLQERKIYSEKIILKVEAASLGDALSSP